VEFTPINIRDLAKLPAAVEVTADSLVAAGVIGSSASPIKLLASGDVSSALTVRVQRVSAAARAKIEAAGGSVEELSPREPKVRHRKHRRQASAPAASGDSRDEAEAKKEENDSGSETSESGATD
jgi:hypothetical protein